MAQIECPYCKHVYELSTDDGHGIETDTTHQEQCVNCDKWFTFQTEVTYSHNSSVADCLNDAKHTLQFEQSNFVGDNLLFRCTTCDGSFNTDDHPVLKNLFFNGEPTSDFEFDKSLIHQFGKAIEKSVWNYDWALKSYKHFINIISPNHKTFCDLTVSMKYKQLLSAIETKEAVFQSFAKLFPNECADIYRC